MAYNTIGILNMHINLNQKALATACFISIAFLSFPVLAEDNAQACANLHDLTSDYSDRVGDLTFTNSSSDYVDVRRVDPDGTSMEMLSIGAGLTTKLTQNRRAVYVGLDSEGKCMGAVKLNESRATITFSD